MPPGCLPFFGHALSLAAGRPWGRHQPRLSRPNEISSRPLQHVPPPRHPLLRTAAPRTRPPNPAAQIHQGQKLLRGIHVPPWQRSRHE